MKIVWPSHRRMASWYRVLAIGNIIHNISMCSVRYIFHWRHNNLHHNCVNGQNETICTENACVHAYAWFDRFHSNFGLRVCIIALKLPLDWSEAKANAQVESGYKLKIFAFNGWNSNAGNSRWFNHLLFQSTKCRDSTSKLKMKKRTQKKRNFITFSIVKFLNCTRYKVHSYYMQS